MTAQGNQVSTTVAPSPVLGNSGQVLINVFKSEVGFLLVLALVLAGLMKIFGTQKGVLANAHFGGAKEKLAARKTALAQMKNRQHDKVTLCVGEPNPNWASATLCTILGGPRSTLYIPDAQQSMIVCGAPNSGKTFSLIDPCVRSAIQQGYPIVVLDMKLGQEDNQLEAHAAYAASNGYKVHVFSPGFPFSGVINPLDFLEDEEDALMARQLAEIINLNSRKSAHSTQNDFFTSAGDQLVEAILLLAKGTAYPDLVMCKQLLGLGNLPTRLRLAKKQGKLNLWSAESFSQFLSTEEAAPTSGGISATAAKTFDTFVKKQLVSSFTGPSSIPLDLSGKQILFLGTNAEKEKVVLPVLASVLHMLVNRNFSRPRKEPLILSLDEFPSIYLPDITIWVNKYRSMGLVAILGYQNEAQLRRKYGEDGAQEIFAACGTKVYFNPRHYATAKMISDYVGEKEVCITQQSRSRGKGGGGTNTSKHYQVRPLKPADEILLFDQGEHIFINGAYKANSRASVPLHQKVSIEERQIRIQKRSGQLWRSLLCNRMIKKMAKYHLSSKDLDNALFERQQTANLLLPEPEEEKTKGGRNEEQAAPLSEHQDEFAQMFGV